MSSTIKDVARHAGVGVATVSRAINNTGYVKPETKRKIEKAIQELHYTPSAIARNLVSSRSNIIGVVIPDITNPFFSFIIKGITQVLNQTNYELIFCNTNEDPKKEMAALHMLMENRVQGIILTPVSEFNPEAAEYVSVIQNSNLPLVMIDRVLENVTCDAILTDNVTAAAEMARLLISNGHKKIALIHGPVSTIPGRERLRGFMEGCESMKLPVNKELIHSSSFLVEGGFQATEAILQNRKNLPTAIFCGNNLITIGCLHVLNKLKIAIPDEISVVGFDQVEPYEVSYQSFTYAARNTEEMGRMATHTLLSRIADPSLPINRIVLRPHLVIRGSEKFPIHPYQGRLEHS